VLLWDTNVSDVHAVSIFSLCVVTPCNVLAGYQRFRAPCCLHLRPEDGGSISYNASQYRRPRLAYKVLVEELHRKRPLVWPRSRRRWKYNIKMDLV